MWHTAHNVPQLPAWVQSLTASLGSEGNDLTLDRSKSDIDVERLADVLFTAEVRERRCQILSILEADRVFDKSRNHYLGPVDKLRVAIGRGKRLHQLAVEHAWSDEDYQIAADLVGEPDPYGLHASLFLVTLREQAAAEQHEKFLDEAERWEYIGCYAQTELAHGSNVRSLETTATWNEEDKSFILHSPSITAAKWWIGSLGKAANHAIVMAQLVVGGKPYGPHAFMVQIRDLKTHGTLPDIHIGDVGPKFGYNTMDTGYLLFNRLKIPHENMLSRFSFVDPQTSEYKRIGSPASLYATMTYVRSVIVQRAGSALARGVTIATRYCAVRRQFASPVKPNGQELQVLDYSTVQMRLLPLLATMYALHFTGNAMIGLHKASRDAESDQKLADLHATSCGLKALASTLAAEGLETCRRVCGGQGYSSFCGIGSWYLDYLPATTWEGDNYMVTQQVARYILKSARSVINGKYPSNDTTDMLAEYWRHIGTKTPYTLDGDMDMEQLSLAFAWRTAHLAFSALRQVDEEGRPWNSLLVEFHRLSTAHSQYLVLKNFHDTLLGPPASEKLDPSTFSALQKLLRLFALTTIDDYALEFLSTDALTLPQVEDVRRVEVPRLMAEIRPHAVRLVDAWCLPDWQLDSALGRKDGRVYEELWRRATVGNLRNEVAFEPAYSSKL